MSGFRMPEFVQSTGALTYVKGPDGERLGRGYHSYYSLAAAGVDGEEARVLVGVVGAVQHILRSDTFEPIVFGSEPMQRGGFWGYVVDAAGILYGYTQERGDGQEPEDWTELGSWPPEGAYDGQ